MNGTQALTGASIGYRLRSWFAHRRLPLALGVLAVVLTLPAISQGWVADDFLHRQMLESLPLSQAIKGLFVFVQQKPGLQFMEISTELGTMPWWSLEGLRIAFFRPLAVLSHQVDYWLWPDSSVLMYLHNILWYAIGCALAAVCYRRFVKPAWIAGLAAFLFTVDVVHLGTVAWLANRNGLMALVLGLLALLAHDRWRSKGWRPGLFWSIVALTLSLFSAEAGLGTVAYLVAYALFLDRDRWSGRIASLIPAVLLVVAWRVVYQGLGYGTWGSGFYLDPVGEPARYAGAVLELGPILLFGQWIGQVPLPYDLLSLPASRVAWLLAVAFLIVVAIVLFPLLKRDRTARFWAVGMLLAVLPACSITLLSGRVLLFAGLGALGLIAQLIGGVLDRAAWVPGMGWRGRSTHVVAVLMIGLHAVIAPLLMPVGAATPGGLQTNINDITDLGRLAGAEEQTVVVVNAPSPFNMIYLPGLRHEMGLPMPARIRVLAPGYCTVSIARTDSNTALVSPDQGFLPRPGTACQSATRRPPPAHIAYLYQLVGTFFRGVWQKMAPGAVVQLSDMRAEVTEVTAAGQAQSATIRFDRSLDDPSLIWLQWDWGTKRYTPFQPPAVGAIVEIPGPY
jgi:hypothetical protein